MRYVAEIPREEREPTNEEIIAAFRTMGEAVARWLLRPPVTIDRPVKTEVEVDPSALLDKQATATLIGISPTTLDRLRRDGLIDYLMVGSKVRFTREEIDRFCSRSTRRNRAGRKPKDYVAPPPLDVLPNRVEALAAKHGVDLKATKMTWDEISRVMGLDRLTFLNWLRRDGHLPQEATQKFEDWCKSIARQLREREATGIIRPWKCAKETK